jgi:hypothetical protein
MGAIAPVKTSSIIGTVDTTTSATVSVDKTFDPEGFIAPGVARWVDRAAGVAVLFPFMTLSVRPPTKASRIYRVTAKIGLPTGETVGNAYNGITPPPTPAYTVLCVMEFMLPERSTSAERTALLSHVRSLFATTINASDAAPSDATGSPLIAAVTNFDGPY